MMNKKAMSVINLFNEMNEADHLKLDSYDWVYSKCSSQSSLAGITKKTKNIYGMTLNTFKKYCDENIDVGFNGVDSLRAKLHKTKSGDKKSSKVNPEDKLKMLEKKVEDLERSKAILIRGYKELNTIAVDLLPKTKRSSIEYRRHRELFSSYFGLSLVINNEK